MHLLEYVGTTICCSLERIACLDLALWLWYGFYFGGWTDLTCDREAIMQWFGQRRTLQIERIDSYGIGEELCKLKCVHCTIIYWEWGYWLTFSVDFYTCCIENNQKKSHSMIAIAIRCILVSLDSVRRSVGTWHDNIQWLALQIWSSLVLLTSGENLETKNDNFSWSRGSYDAFEDVPRPQQHSRKGCECTIWAGGSISFANAWFICLTNNSCKMQQIVISREPTVQWRSQNMLWAWEDIEDNDTSLVFELQWRIDFVAVDWLV